MILHLLLFFFFFISFFNPTTTSELCSTALCGSHSIRFPFRLKNLQPDLCGYPGFTLSCLSGGQPAIDLPPAGKFSVQQINYQTQEIWVTDPENCLPRKLLSLNLSGSPFAGEFSQDFTFFNCSSNYLAYGGLNPIACLSGETHTVFASSSPATVARLSESCREIKRVSVAVQWSFYEAVRSSDLSGDQRWRWERPGCGRCEIVGGRCGFRGDSSHAVVCTNIPKRGIPRFARYAVSIGVGVPASLCLLGIICWFCTRIRSSYSSPRHSAFEAHWTISLQPTFIMGLDGPTIDSYPKTVLGQSMRIPKPNDNTCPICLSEYRPKEILKSIPDCLHCFHQQCIDEWLRLNASCPVCRNSPAKSPPSAAP